VICFFVRSARFHAAALVTRRTCLPQSRKAFFATLSRTFLSTDSSCRVNLASDDLSTVAVMYPDPFPVLFPGIDGTTDGLPIRDIKFNIDHRH